MLCTEFPQAKANKLERCKRISVAWEAITHKSQVITCVHDCNNYATYIKLYAETASNETVLNEAC